jgi:quinol monooxygenase YgiN
MKQIQIIARLRIHQGQLEKFKEIAQKCMDTVRAKDTGVLQYNWFFNDDESECVVCELYEDSQAVTRHKENLGETLGTLLALADLSVELYGTPTKELVDGMAGLDAKFYSFYLGL